MGGNQGEPSSSAREPAGSRERDGVPPEPDEHVGPVSIARHVKTDGRTLILYTVDQQPPT